MFKKLLQLKTLLIALLVMTGAGNAWGTDIVVTLNNIGSSIASTANTEAATTDITAEGTTDSYTLNYYQCKQQGSAMLMTKNVSPYISNKTAMPGNIKSVEVFINSGASGKTTYDCAFSATECTTATEGIGAVKITGGNSHKYSNLNNGSIIVKGKFFCITLGNANNGQVLKLVITCESESSATEVATTTTINATGIENTDVYTSTAAGSLSATVEDNNNTEINSATVTWSGNNDAVATIDSSTGAVTLVGAGEVTFTANYAGETGVYQASSATYEMTVTDSRYSQCIISNLTFTAKCNGSGTADDGAEWGVTSDGTESNFDDARGIHYGTNSANVQYIELLTSDINGTIKKIVVNASTASGVTATVGVNVGGSAFGGEAQTLTTSAKDYTFTGSAKGEIIVTVTKPSSAVKAIYVKSVKVYYERSTDPSITVDNATVDVSAASAEGTITVTYENIDEIAAEVAFYEANGTTKATYDWIEAEIDANNNVYYVIGENSGVARTAYLKVYALDDDANDVYSELITINQAAYVAPALTQINLTKTLVFSIDDNSDLSGTYAYNNTRTNLYGKWEGDATPTEFEGFAFSQISKQNAFQFQANAGSITFPPIISTYGFDVTYEATYNDVTVFIDDVEGSSTSSTNAMLMLKRTTDGAAKITSITLTPKAAPVTVNVGTTKYATLYSDANLVVPEGITVYAVRVNDNANALVVTEVAVEEFTTIEGGQGYMLKADAAGSYTFTATSNAADMDGATGNLLKGTMTATKITAESGHQLYKLANGENGIGFYLDSNEGTTLKNGANKAYLDVPTTLSIRGFALSDAITAIEAIEMKNSVAEGLYDLQGRRVHDVQKGIYVVNGKKLFVK